MQICANIWAAKRNKWPITAHILKMKRQEDLIIEAARLYYEHNLTQTQIGRKLNTSRSTVSRLLQQARDTGIVQIKIEYPWRRNTELEHTLMSRYRVREVRVLESLGRSSESIFDGLGKLAAEYLDSFVRNDMVLGVSYGRSIAATIRNLQPARPVRMETVQILGALGSGNPLIEGPDLVREMASKYGASYRYLHTPMIVESEQTCELLMNEPYVKDTLEVGRNADAVILGIGAHYAKESGMIWTGYVAKKDLSFLQSRGAIGHMCAQHFDANGNVLDLELNRRVISIGIEALHNIETVIAIAGTKEKALAIHGALKGRYIDVLIVDDGAAREVLKLA